MVVESSKAARLVMVQFHQSHNIFVVLILEVILFVAILNLILCVELRFY